MAPNITTTVEQTRRALAVVRAQGKTIGLVPTMGALHAGHASLIRAAHTDNDFVVVSIFVNPTQFGPKEDLARYPRPFDRDVQICMEEGVDLLFHPTADVMYPAPYRTYIEVEQLQDVLCGVSRPGHFRGVATVVLKLFNMMQPQRAYFGQKDAQQVRILLQMVRDLNVPVEMIICPISREADGLAMSSRNIYLDAEQRRQASVLVRVLQTLQNRIETGERHREALQELARTMIEATPGARLDYVAVVDFEHLQPLEPLQGEVLIALAVFFGTTRLIDNVLLDVSEDAGTGRE